MHAWLTHIYPRLSLVLYYMRRGMIWNLRVAYTHTHTHTHTPRGKSLESKKERANGAVRRFPMAQYDVRWRYVLSRGKSDPPRAGRRIRGMQITHEVLKKIRDSRPFLHTYTHTERERHTHTILHISSALTVSLYITFCWFLLLPQRMMQKGWLAWSVVLLKGDGSKRSEIEVEIAIELEREEGNDAYITIRYGTGTGTGWGGTGTALF